MALFKTDASTILDASRIEIVGDRGDSNIVIHAFNNSYVVSYADTISSFNAKAPLIQITATDYVPVAAISSVVARPDGTATIATFSGRLLASTLTFAAISTALAPLTP